MNPDSKKFYESLMLKDEEFIKRFKTGDAYKAFKRFYDENHKDEFVRYIKSTRFDEKKLEITHGAPKKPKGASASAGNSLDFVEASAGYKEAEGKEMKRNIISLPPMFASKINFKKGKINFKLRHLDSEYHDLFGNYSEIKPGNIDPKSFFGRYYQGLNTSLAEKKITLNKKVLTKNDVKIYFAKDSGIPLWWDVSEDIDEESVPKAEPILTCKIRQNAVFAKTDDPKETVDYSTEFVHMQGGQEGIPKIIKDSALAEKCLQNKGLICLVYLDMSRVLVSSSKTQSVARIQKIRYLPIDLPSSKLKGGDDEEVFTFDDQTGLDLSAPSGCPSPTKSNPESKLDECNEQTPEEFVAN